MQNHSIKILLAAALGACALPAFAVLNILACEPEWGALAQELGGDKVSIYSATNAFQDPHHVQAKPSLLARARNADLLVCTGAQLEIGWLPILQQQAGNPKIQAGQPGYFEAARSVRKDVILLCHGGPISMPDDARYILDRCKGLHGFYGASSMERLPAEAAIARQTADFKAVTLHDKKTRKG